MGFDAELNELTGVDFIKQNETPGLVAIFLDEAEWKGYEKVIIRTFRSNNPLNAIAQSGWWNYKKVPAL